MPWHQKLVNYQGGGGKNKLQKRPTLEESILLLQDSDRLVAGVAVGLGRGVLGLGLVGRGDVGRPGPVGRLGPVGESHQDQGSDDELKHQGMILSQSDIATA